MNSTKIKYKKHNHYRLIALIAKLISVVILTYAFSGLLLPIKFFNFEPQTLGTFLTTLCSLIIYYGIIFFLNRYRNFHSESSLWVGLIIYTIVIIILITVETTYIGVVQNSLYRLFNLGYTTDTISVSTVIAPYIYILLGLFVHFMFSLITGTIIFFLYKFILDNKKIVGKA